MLHDIDDHTGKAAVIQLCSSGQWPPTVAEIREMELTIREGDVVAPSPWEAWEQALDGRSVTPIENRALKLIGGTWEIKHTKNQGVTRSNFVKAYGELLESDRRRRLALPSVKRLAESNRPPEVTPVEKRIEQPASRPATQEEVREMINKLGNDNVKSIMNVANLFEEEL
jgi:hypothetical protein